MANSERPNVLGRAFQRTMSGWTGRWTVALEDGTHVIGAVLKMGLIGNPLTMSADGQQIDTASIFVFLGEIRRFRWRGHDFSLRVRGMGLSGEFVLLMDGSELTPDEPVPAAVAPGTDSGRSSAAAANAAHIPQVPQLQREIDVLECDEVIAVEEYPLDNSFGDLALVTDRQISKASTNECSVEMSGQLSGSVNAQILTMIKADVSAELSRKTGAKVGETVTESQTLHLSVGAKAAVLYRVLWKRRVRTGQRVYSVENGELTVPYRLTYGLSCEVQSQELKPRI